MSEEGISHPFWRAPDAIARIRQLLPALPEGSGSTTFLPQIVAAAPERALHCRAAVASTLMAGLELARGGVLMLD